MDDVDAFLASLDQYTAPSIDAGIDNVGGASREVTGDDVHAVHSTGHHAHAALHGRPTRRARSIAGQDDMAATPALSWSCAACHARNAAHATRCATCNEPHDGPRIITVPAPQREVACQRCTFLNDPQRRTCEMCEATLPAQETAPCASAQTETHLHHTLPSLQLPALQRSQHDTTMTPPYQSSDHFESATSSSTSTISSTSSSDEDDDSMSASDGSASHTDRDNDDVVDGGAGGAAAGGQQLVRFLQTLEAVPYDQLPCAPVPHTMQAQGHLRPFQLQALHWMLRREHGGVGGPDDAHATTHSTSSLPSSSAQPPRLLAPSETNTRHTSQSATASSARCAVGPSSGGQDLSAVHTVRGGIYADYMGMGKTRTVVALCESTRQPRYDRVVGSMVASSASLIVCPTSLLMQWAQEIRRCVQPVPRILLYHGSRKRRLTLFELAQEYDYVLTSYQTLCHEPAATADPPGKVYMIRWHRIVLDEAHCIRNLHTLQSRACMGLCALHRWAVTATPVQNTINDLLPLLRFLQVPHFSSIPWWNGQIVRYLNEDQNHPRPVTALRLLFGALLLRRTPDSLVQGRPILSLPSKQLHTQLVALSGEQRAFYEQTHRNAMSKLDGLREGRRQRQQLPFIAFSTVLEMLIRCRQSCLHPYIVVAALRRLYGEASSTAAAAAPPASSSSPTGAEARHDVDEAVAHATRRRMVDRYVDHVLARRLHVDAGGASEFVQSLLTALREQRLEEQECIICLDTLHSPAILPCAHVFCAECITHALEVGHRCPLCKQRTSRSQLLRVPEQLLASRAAPAPADAVQAVKADLRQFSNWPLTLSAKTTALLEAIARIPAGEKAVVFSSFVTYLQYVAHCLEQAHVSCALYTGALTVRQKAAVLRAFDDEEGDGGCDAQRSAQPAGRPRVLLASVTTSGVGLNLTRANHCFLMEPTWNPGVVEQALNRVYRIGQTRPVHIVQFIAAGTVEEKIEALCARKRGLLSYVFGAGNGGPNGYSHKPTTEELLALFDDGSDDDDDDGDDESTSDA